MLRISPLEIRNYLASKILVSHFKLTHYYFNLSADQF